MPRRRHLVVCLAGAVGSGKTTVARALAADLDATIAGFGDFVRHIAAENNEPTDRNTLQRLGQSLVEADAIGFTRRFTDWARFDATRSIIIEGVRHASAYDAIRDFAQTIGAVPFLIFLNTSSNVRAVRRFGGDLSALIRVDLHAAERQTVDVLERRADLTVDGAKPLDEVVGAIRGGLFSLTDACAP